MVMDDPHPARSTALVGREPARTALKAALGVADGGRAATIVVEGEAGSGKTLLVEWLLAEATRRAVRHVAVRPVEGEADLPLAVMIDIIRPLSDVLPGLAAEHREILAAAAGGAGRASTDRLLLAAATLALLTAAAEDAPLLLVVDDAHWVDLASGQALSFAVHRAAVRGCRAAGVQRHPAVPRAGRGPPYAPRRAAGRGSRPPSRPMPIAIVLVAAVGVACRGSRSRWCITALG
jgi:AAA ATPase domain